MNSEVNTSLPPEIANLLANTPETTQEMLDELAQANHELVNDPAFLADLERAKFVEAILQAISERQIRRADLARSIGKTRQYVQKALDEDGRVSFTLKTMVSFCHALGKELRIEVVDKAVAKEACIQFPIARTISPRPLQERFEPARSHHRSREGIVVDKSMRKDAKTLTYKQVHEELSLSA